jgi:hypothetical protein
MLDMASAAGAPASFVTARVASLEYLDYLHFAKTEDGWKVVNVPFHARD